MKGIPPLALEVMIARAEVDLARWMAELDDTEAAFSAALRRRERVQKRVDEARQLVAQLRGR